MIPAAVYTIKKPLNQTLPLGTRIQFLVTSITELALTSLACVSFKKKPTQTPKISKHGTYYAVISL